jgi:release factor glutamine methyltransferase
MLLAQYKSPPFPERVLDVGTGSGIIALTLAAAWTEARLEAVDFSQDALNLAMENASQLGVAERVRVYRSDLLESTVGVYDLIVANLPYIAAAEISGLSREVQFDPLSALDGGPAGTEIIFRLIAQATGHLRGQIALEIGHEQTGAICDELAKHNYQDIRAATDYQGRNRFVFAKHG